MADRRADEAVRREAHDWSMRMHGDDAETHRAAFERWRAADPRHAETYARLARQWTSAALLAQSPIGQTRALPATRSRRWAAPMGYALAVAVIVLAIGLWFGVPGPWAGRDPAVPQLASRVGEIRTLELADGSVVTLDTDSTVQVEFSPTQRRVVLTRGRARFNVAHDAARPFIVVAGSGAVVAHGTIFDVSLVGGQVRVTLLRGVVDVRNNDGEDRLHAAAPAVRLHAGERTQFAANEPPALPRIAAPAESVWVSGMLSFDADSLGDAIAQANRYSEAQIRIADPSLDALKVTGAYRIGDADGLARALAASLNLEAVAQPNGDVVLARPSD